MKQLTYLLALTLVLLFACNNHNPDNEKGEVADTLKKEIEKSEVKEEEKEKVIIEIEAGSKEIIKIDTTSIIVIEYDSLEFERFETGLSEEDLYIIWDDWSYYNYELREKMESLGVPIHWTNKDSVIIKYNNIDTIIVKDESFRFYNYYELDSGKIESKDVFELLE